MVWAGTASGSRSSSHMSSSREATRVELYSGGYLNYEPDWEPVIWKAGEQRSVNAWTVDQMGPSSYLHYATPPLPSEVAPALAEKH